MTYASRPERKGYRLTEEGENLYAEWLDMRGCSCHTGCAPCSKCTFEGHPISLEETDEVWEPDVVIKPATPVFPEGSTMRLIYEQWLAKQEGGNDEMSRSDVINVKEPPNSPWFGYKYRVTPETSKLLQEAVFKDGGGWSGYKEVKYTAMEYIFVKYNGDMTFSNNEHHFITHTLLSKTPPQVEIPQPETKKEFKVGYWYKLKDRTYGLDVDKYYRIKELDVRGSCVRVYIGDSCSGTIHETRFDINSESSLNPTIEQPRGTPDHLLDSLSTCVGMVRQTNDLTKQTEEKQTMSNANRRVVNVKLLDNDSGLPVEYALVAQFQGIVTEDSDEVVKQEILLNKKIADAIAKHNEKRVEQTDLEILKRTGNDVKLRQVKLKDLTWIVSAA